MCTIATRRSISNSEGPELEIERRVWLRFVQAAGGSESSLGSKVNGSRLTCKGAAWATVAVLSCSHYRTHGIDEGLSYYCPIEGRVS